MLAQVTWGVGALIGGGVAVAGALMAYGRRTGANAIKEALSKPVQEVVNQLAVLNVGLRVIEAKQDGHTVDIKALYGKWDELLKATMSKADCIRFHEPLERRLGAVENTCRQQRGQEQG